MRHLIAFSMLPAAGLFNATLGLAQVAERVDTTFFGGLSQVTLGDEGTAFPTPEEIDKLIKKLECIANHPDNPEECEEETAANAPHPFERLFWSAALTNSQTTAGDEWPGWPELGDIDELINKLECIANHPDNPEECDKKEDEEMSSAPSQAQRCQLTVGGDSAIALSCDLIIDAALATDSVSSFALHWQVMSWNEQLQRLEPTTAVGCLVQLSERELAFSPVEQIAQRINRADSCRRAGLSAQQQQGQLLIHYLPQTIEQSTLPGLQSTALLIQ